MPSRSGANSSRRSFTPLRWRASMLTGWCRSRQLRALARNLPGTSCPAGQPRAAKGASGPGNGPPRQQPRRGPGRMFHHTSPARAATKWSLPAAPTASAATRWSAWLSPPGAPPPIVHSPSGHRPPLLSPPFPGRCAPAGKRPGRPWLRQRGRIRRRSAPSARPAGLPAAHLSHTVQARVRFVLKRVSTSRGHVPGRATGKSSQGSKGGLHGLQRLRNCCAFHTHSMSAGTDN